MSRPSSSAPPSPMKIRAGWKLNGRKPTHIPSTITAMSGLMLLLAFGSSPWSNSSVAVEGEGAGGDADDAGGQAVEAVDEVHGVGHADAPRAR